MTNIQRKEILRLAQFAWIRGEHDTARFLFASVNISYIPSTALKGKY